MNKTRVPSAWIVGLFICISFIAVESTFHFEDALAASIVEEALAGVTVSSVSSGNWSDPSVWSTGAVPGAGDSVRISQGTTVTYDVLSDVVLGGLIVKGTLRYSRTENTRLKTSDNILVNSGGFFDIGTAQQPIPNGVMSELIFVLAEGYTFTGGAAMEPRWSRGTKVCG